MGPTGAPPIQKCACDSKAVEVETYWRAGENCLVKSCLGVRAHQMGRGGQPQVDSGLPVGPCVGDSAACAGDGACKSRGQWSRTNGRASSLL
jgi:hypothetical protein